ncbi:MAG: hypothetical protein ABSG53_23780 [Thermoguttaceae bacterium]|jgi:hypothetical protein
MKRSDDHGYMPRPEFGPQHAEAIRIRCPSTLLPVVKHAAGRQTISASAYVRQAIVDRLKRDGFDFPSDGENYKTVPAAAP